MCICISLCSEVLVQCRAKAESWGLVNIGLRKGSTLTSPLPQRSHKDRSMQAGLNWSPGKVQQRFNSCVSSIYSTCKGASTSPFPSYRTTMPHCMGHPSALLCNLLSNRLSHWRCPMCPGVPLQKGKQRHFLELLTCHMCGLSSSHWVTSISGWMFQSPNTSQSPSSPGSSVSKVVWQEYPSPHK